MLRPGHRLVRLLVAAASPAVLAPWWRPASWLALGAAAGVLLLMAIEAWWLGRVQVSLRWPARNAVSIGQDGVLPLALRHDAAATLALAVRCRLGDLLGAGAVDGAGACAPGRELALDFPIHGRERGRCVLARPVASWTRFGLAERIAAIGVEAQCTVLPDLEAVKRLHRRLDALFLRGLGTRLAPRQGQGREFDRLREYVLGDDWRHLAWKSSARRGTLIVREFRVERSQEVLFCIDAGHRMAARLAGTQGWLSRVDHAVNAAVLTAWLCQRCEDRIGLLSFAADIDRGVLQGRGAAHLAALTAFASGVAAHHEHADYRALAAHLQRRLRHRTLVIIATVLPDPGGEGDLLAAVRLLSPRHLPLVLVFTDPVLEAAAVTCPSDRDELCRTLVAADVVDSRRHLAKQLRRLGALVVETQPSDAGTAAVNAYLDVKRRQVL